MYNIAKHYRNESVPSDEREFSRCLNMYSLVPGVQLKSGPYGPYFNISNLFTEWQTTPKNLWT